MEDFRDTVEVLTESDDEHEHRVRVRVTVLVVLVTALAALSGFLAAHSDGRALNAERHEQVLALQAQNAEDQLSAVTQSQNETGLAQQVDFYRGAAFSSVGDTRASDDWLGFADVLGKQELNAEPSPSGAYRRETVKAEESAALGQAAIAWRDHQSSYIATAGMLAISLFLLGLVLTVSRHRVRWVFFGAAALLATIAGGRLLVTSINPVPSEDSKAIATEAQGETDLMYGQSGRATHIFVKLINANPGWQNLGQIWFGLGQSLDDSSSYTIPTKAELTRAVFAYSRSIALGFATTQPGMWNNLAFDELEIGRAGEAGDDTKIAVQTAKANGNEEAWSQGTLAEVYMFRGNLREAESMLQTAELSLIDSGNSDEAAQDFFASMRSDWMFFAQKKMVPLPRLRAFYSFGEGLEAAFDERLKTVQPVRSAATVSAFRVTYQSLDTSQDEGLLTTAFAYSGFRQGKFSFTTYDVSNTMATLIPEASVLDGYPWTWGSGTGAWVRPWPIQIFAGDLYEVQAYWNGNLLATACLRASSDGTRLSPATGCVA